MPALVVKDGPSAGHRIEIGAETELGRVGTGFLQEDAEASRRHAVVRTSPGGLEIEDLGSSNGTWVNDERIAGARTLAHGDRIRIGQTTLEVELTAPPPPAPIPETTDPIQSSAPQAAAQTPTAPPPPAAAVASEAARPLREGAPGARPAAVTTASILLFIVSFVSAAYAMFALLNNMELLLQVFDIAPFAFNAFYVLLVPAALLAVLQVIAAARLQSMKGRVLGLVSTAFALAAWGGAFAALVIVSGTVLDYAVIVVVLALDLAIVAVLTATGRSLVRRP
jgi:hypothetical protein